MKLPGFRPVLFSLTVYFRRRCRRGLVSLLVASSLVLTLASQIHAATPDPAASSATTFEAIGCGESIDRIGDRALIEGDIVIGRCLDEGDRATRFEPRGAYAEWITSPAAKAGTAPPDWSWPGATVPFAISEAFVSVEPAVVERILSAIRHWNTASAVRLVPRTDEGDYIEFIPSSGCWSWVGHIGGRQEIGLDAAGECSFGSTVHEIGHALGFYHEQSRTDRDLYVDIIWDKIVPANRHQFETYERGRDRGPYDYGSVMHYAATAFSIDNSPTIVPVPSAYDAWAAIYGEIPIGQRAGTSPLDRQAASDLYESCFDREPQTDPFWSTGPWGACSSSCEAPGRTRRIHCHDASGACVDAEFCAEVWRPGASSSCAAELDCDFENDTCGWDGFDAGDDFEWLSARALGDHTIGSGYYVYAEASSPRRPGDVAFLTSVPFNVPNDSVLTFWYRLLGETPSTLEVEFAPCGGPVQTLLEVHSSEPGDEWRQASVALPRTFDGRVRFKAILGESSDGNIAIDDIRISGTGPIFSDGFEIGDSTSWALSGS